MPHRNTVVPFERPVAWLNLPLNQERAARLVQFEEKTGISVLSALTDALDDIIFDISGTARSDCGNE